MCVGAGGWCVCVCICIYTHTYTHTYGVGGCTRVPERYNRCGKAARELRGFQNRFSWFLYLLNQTLVFSGRSRPDLEHNIIQHTIF